MGTCVERVFQKKKKNSLQPNAASHNNASWYTDPDGFLEHSASGGSLYYNGPGLQKIIPFWGWGPPSYTLVVFSIPTSIRILSFKLKLRRILRFKKLKIYISYTL